MRCLHFRIKFVFVNIISQTFFFPTVLSQPISRQHMADCSWHGQDGNAHNHRPSPQHHLPVHCPCCQCLWPEWPEPHLGARQNARSVCTSFTPKKTWLSSCFGSSALRRGGFVYFLQMWTLQAREWTTGRSRGSWERWPSSCKIPPC